MIETIINDINYRLDEDNLTAEVMENEGYEGDIIIPETVVFNERTYRVTSIGEGAFFHCESLTDITIPNSVKSIEDGAFCQCSSLTSITIPNSVTSIEYAAFWDCTLLTSITFQGTIAQWGKIEFGEDWIFKISTNVVHCTDGDVEI